MSVFMGNKANWAPAPSRNVVAWHQTNPIRAWGAAPSGTKRAKQTQFCTRGGDRWGKPHPTRGHNCVKQSQFEPEGQLRPGRDARNKPNSHSPGGVGGASPTLQVGTIAPNKPNSGPRVQFPAGRNVRNKAKLGRTGRCRQRRSSCAGRLRREVLHKTKPICSGSSARAAGPEVEMPPIGTSVQNKANQNHRQSRWYEEGP